jgi:6-pyruvoyltetrahydropterin/6-carboxytetrahydropterin synthase
VFSVGIREHVMIAHSFRGELFGPAQALHGATYVVDVVLSSKALGPDNVVVDIARAGDTLRAELARLAYKNLDELPEFQGVNTTTEYLARFVFDRMAGAARAGALGAGGASVVSMKVTLHESHVAWASYEGEVVAHG